MKRIDVVKIIINVVFTYPQIEKEIDTRLLCLILNTGYVIIIFILLVYPCMPLPPLKFILIDYLTN